MTTRTPDPGAHCVARRDQHRAAARDARRQLAALVTRHGGALTTTGHPWLTRRLANLGAALTAGTAELCPHITDAPAVVHAAVWAPGRLVCGRCLPALIPDPAEDGTCDRCRTPTNVINPALANLGPLLIAFGLCPDCARHLAPEGARP